MVAPVGEGREAPARLDVAAIRADFPILASTVRGKPLVYLDSAASSQRPRPVLEAVERLYTSEYANVHRGVYWLSQRSTELYEGARETVRDFLGAADTREIVFTRGTTEAINLVARAWGGANLGPGDEILLTTMEHHSNIVPWQMIAAERGAGIRVLPVRDDGSLELEALDRLLSPRTRIMAVTHVSNALGTVNPIARLAEAAHRVGALVLVDGAQAVPHMKVDVRALGADFYAFSGHKVFGPTGIGVLYGRLDLLAAMPPWQGGGDMIRTVSLEHGTTYAEPPARFEAGTPDIAGAVGLAAALDYLAGLGWDRISAHDRELLAEGTRLLSGVPGLRLVGTAPEKSGVLSFVMEGAHPHDIGTILDRRGIAIRTGHHCAQPLMERLGLPATARASIALYNTAEELERLAEALSDVHRIFA